tara:strand:+ start:388 stop:672 length:285 start_codon:yes stop_codon:yes gene_type:complete
MSFIIGITGQVGSGKTFAADHINSQLNCDYLDLDKIGHQLLTQKKVITQLQHDFGDTIIEDNKVSRKKLGDIVFSDYSKLSQLNQYIHPLIKQN